MEKRPWCPKRLILTHNFTTKLALTLRHRNIENRARASLESVLNQKVAGSVLTSHPSSKILSFAPIYQHVLKVYKIRQVGVQTEL